MFRRARLAALAAVCALELPCPLSSHALEFPGPAPGPAQSSNTNGLLRLENNVLSMAWALSNSQFSAATFVNKLSTQSWAQAGSELFRLEYSQMPTQAVRLNVAASECALVSGPQLRPSQPSSSSSRAGDRMPGQEVVASFLHSPSGLRVDWRAALRDEANYLRQFLTISGDNTNFQITGVELLDYATGTNVPAQVGIFLGSPAVAGQVFFGAETPFGNNTLAANRVRCSVPATLSLGTNVAYDLSGVVGVFPSGQQRRGFLFYLDRERAMPYRPFLHFNAWLDLAQNQTETTMLTNINAIDLEMRQRRGAALDSYVLDDGWDNPGMGFWAIDTNKFPHRFDVLANTVVNNGSHLGIWISPLGGYTWQTERVQAAINEGIITRALDLSLPSYYNWWTNKCATFISQNEVNYFKWDKAGTGVNPHFMALLRAAAALRGYTTNLFINVTVGSWPSPFWLSHVDSTWRGGQDLGAAGVGDAREQWITYRDGVTWGNVVRYAPLYPLNSLMLHGIIQANGGGSISQAGTDLRHEARSFFGSGLNLQELYLTPAMLTSNSWDQLAQAALWARSNAPTLIDSHWLGGNPNNLDIYGWASWCPAKGIIVLRNPSAETNSISLDVGAAFELPPCAATDYDLAPAYPDQRPNVTFAAAGQPTTFTLEPFEVMVLEASPHAGLVPPTIVQQPSPARVLLGGTATFSAAADGGPPLRLQWNFNGARLPDTTNSTLVLSNLTYDQAGDYQLQASNPVCAVSSRSARLTVVTPGPYSTALLSAKPVAYWRLDETNGPTVLDLASGHEGTALGNLTFGVPGALTNDLDTAVHFDAANHGSVDVNYAPELNAPAFSFELWARVTGGLNTYRSPLTSRDDSPPRGYICYASSNNRWEFWIGRGATPWQMLSGPMVVLGEWAHLGGTYDGTNMVLYVNGQPVASALVSFVPNTARPLRIGGGATESSGNYFFTGEVDEVAVYDHALTGSQVQQHYQAAPLLPRVGVERKGGGVRLTWPTGVLEQAHGVRGPWGSLTGVASPWTFYPTNSPLVFRLKVR
jgi:hypothetical protein